MSRYGSGQQSYTWVFLVAGTSVKRREYFLFKLFKTYPSDAIPRFPHKYLNPLDQLLVVIQAETKMWDLQIIAELIRNLGNSS